MVNERCIERRILKNGIEVVVTIREKTFDVCITIGTDADISQKYKCEEFTIKFRLLNKSKKLEEPVRLEKKKRKYDNGSATRNEKLVFKNEEYRCEIFLAPRFYVP